MRLMASFAFGFVLFACSSSDSTPETASSAHAADSVDATTTESALAIATTGSASFEPAGCETSATAGSKTTYTFAGCSGPYGLVKVSGTIEVDLGATKAGATAHLTSSGLSVNGATLNLDLDVTETATSVTIASNSTATGSRGGALTFAGSYTASFDQAAQCVSLTGNWSTKFDDLTWATSATGYQHCAGKCPAAGGKVTFAGPAGRSIAIAYDGSATAEVTDTKGQTSAVSLPCE